MQQGKFMIFLEVDADAICQSDVLDLRDCEVKGRGRYLIRTQTGSGAAAEEKQGDEKEERNLLHSPPPGRARVMTVRFSGLK
jgi:hypothetical protein